jgi:hypothetical protein
MNDFETCTHTTSKINRVFPCSTISIPMQYNVSNKSIVIFSDEKNKSYVVPYFEEIIDILSKAGYKRNDKMYVPGFDKGCYPESKERWENVKNTISSIK